MTAGANLQHIQLPTEISSDNYNGYIIVIV